MAQLAVRHLENAVKVGLRRRARKRGRRMEEEVRDILRSAVNEEVRVGGLGSEIAGLFAEVGLHSDISELRGHEIQLASLEP